MEYELYLNKAVLLKKKISSFSFLEKAASLHKLSEFLIINSKTL